MRRWTGGTGIKFEQTCLMVRTAFELLNIWVFDIDVKILVSDMGCHSPPPLKKSRPEITKGEGF